MKNINRLNLVLGFGLISSVSFGQTPKTVENTPPLQKKEIQEKREVKEVKSPAPTYEKKSATPIKQEVPAHHQEIQPVKNTEEATPVSTEYTNETTTTKQVEAKKSERVKPTVTPVHIPTKPPKN